MKDKKSKLKSKILRNFYKIGGKLKNNGRRIDEISFQELEYIKSESVLIDVRSFQEYNEGHINGSINIPLYDINKKIYEFIQDKNKNIILYCQSGKRSKKAAIILEGMGFTNVYNLKGGLDSI